MASLADLSTIVDFSKQSLLISAAAIAFNPTAWNIVARNGTSPRCPLSTLEMLTALHRA